MAEENRSAQPISSSQGSEALSSSVTNITSPIHYTLPWQILHFNDLLDQGEAQTTAFDGARQFFSAPVESIEYPFLLMF